MPVYSPIIRELELPRAGVEAFARLTQRPGVVLLEGSTREPRLGRWSFLACDPFLIFRSKGRKIELRRGTAAEVREGNPFRVLRELLNQYQVIRPEGECVPPLLAGAIGYFGYDLGRFVEYIPELTTDDVPVADCHLGFYGAVIALDHVTNRAWISAIGAPEEDERKAQRLAEERVEEYSSLTTGEPYSPRLLAYSPTRLSVLSNFTRSSYLAAIRQAKEYIAAGDIYQVNLSQRLSAPLATTPFDLYRNLTRTNPAPFSAYLETPDAAIVSCSPERFLQVRGREVETRPIKGTRPRGATPEEDARLAAELLASEKDRAENVMIVDLERNDLGRVCEYGSVHVPELFAVESYATVHHLVSTVRGRLHAGKTALDCLRACFPGGSITGAPKVRAMEIIEELEPTRRGVYTGAIGYLCFSGDMDVNIVIRTLVVKDGRAYFQVGGGLVADSNPEAEYQETIDKAQALARGLAAEAGVEDIAWPE
jgi:para-aminobenzoate synthetase component 1